MNWKKYIKLLFLSSYFIILGHNVLPHNHHYNCDIDSSEKKENHCDNHQKKDHDEDHNHEDEHNNTFPDHCHAFNSLNYQNENDYTQLQVFCFELVYNIFNSEIADTPIKGIRTPFRKVFIKEPLVLNSHNLRAPPSIR